MSDHQHKTVELKVKRWKVKVTR